MSLEHKQWYWLSLPEEGDIFYPVYIVDDEYLLMDGKHEKIDENGGVTFTKAIMPDQQQ